MKSFSTFHPNHRNRTICLFLVVFLSLFATEKLFAGNLTLTWNPSTSANVGGYKLYYGLTTKNYTNNIDTAKLTSYQVTGLTAGAKYFFAVKAYNTTKTVESAFSTEVSGVVPTTSSLTVNFSASKTNGSTPLVVSFTPATTGTVTGWNWNFGDTAIPVSTSQNPTVTYSKPGVYTVSLKASGPTGSVTATKTGFITVAAPSPVANFSATPKTGNAPLSVGFSDTSTGTINTRLWNFGDGTTSASANPNHIYNTAGLYNISLTVTGPNGTNTKTSAGFINVTSSSTTIPPGQGPVAVYSFEENSGNIIADASGKGNHGVLTEATRVNTGHYGKGLLFDGINDWITVNDSASLDLNSAYTLEAWVKPVSYGPGNILVKEQAGGSVYSLYSSEDADFPIGAFNDAAGYRVVSGTSILPVNQWSHLISTYNGDNQRLYVNGVQVAIRAQTGLIKQSNGVLHIGGNSVWGEFFHGYIDDIRIYNRALSLTEITKDYTTPTNLTSPSKIVAGSKTRYTATDSNAQGTAEAFKIVSSKNSVLTRIATYLDASSKATELVVGIYNDNAGHPGTLLAQGKLTTLTLADWNRVPINSVKLLAAKSYWIAILGLNGQIKFRDNLGTGNQPLETSAATNLVKLPATWVTGNVYSNDGPISSYGIGYFGP
ncbi:MAG: PKD domain-containing protein [Methylococcaceae bacterium]|nr:PKD domain-containing protein [Methylococcaceae bacterium]